MSIYLGVLMYSMSDGVGFTVYSKCVYAYVCAFPCPSGADTSPVFSVVEAVHAHYVPALTQYGSLEQQTLHIALQSISLVRL